jgi:hypothetical protein
MKLDLGFLDFALYFCSSNASQTEEFFANQCVNRWLIAFFNLWSLNIAVKMIVQVCSKVYMLFHLPFVCLNCI